MRVLSVSLLTAAFLSSAFQGANAKGDLSSAFHENNSGTRMASVLRPLADALRAELDDTPPPPPPRPPLQGAVLPPPPPPPPPAEQGLNHHRGPQVVLDEATLKAQIKKMQKKKGPAGAQGAMVGDEQALLTHGLLVSKLGANPNAYRSPQEEFEGISSYLLSKYGDYQGITLNEKSEAVRRITMIYTTLPQDVKVLYLEAFDLAFQKATKEGRRGSKAIRYPADILPDLINESQKASKNSIFKTALETLIRYISLSERSYKEGNGVDETPYNQGVQKFLERIYPRPQGVSADVIESEIDKIHLLNFSLADPQSKRIFMEMINGFCGIQKKRMDTFLPLAQEVESRLKRSNYDAIDLRFVNNASEYKRAHQKMMGELKSALQDEYDVVIREFQEAAEGTTHWSELSKKLKDLGSFIEK